MQMGQRRVILARSQISASYLDLDAILEDEWPLFRDLFTDYTANRKQLSKDLRRLNGIRNKVMHPVRGLIPDEEDFDFVHGLQRSFRCP